MMFFWKLHIPANFDLRSTGGPPLTLFFGTAEKKLEEKSALEEDFLSTIYYQIKTAEFHKKQQVRQKSAHE